MFYAILVSTLLILVANNPKVAAQNDLTDDEVEDLLREIYDRLLKLSQTLGNVKMCRSVLNFLNLMDVALGPYDLKPTKLWCVIGRYYSCGKSISDKEAGVDCSRFSSV
ncbi:hypothetical protein Zmor_005166 [Zophobas morio]|uniref:Uncharacterized protein n=1 Tax=Zophobas morio TaxID=2755281 RepID=A0AA38IRK5_9CUCU|nr:hypothetical protein Zmor_005166 [Zophobas morio]